MKMGALFSGVLLATLIGQPAISDSQSQDKPIFGNTGASIDKSEIPILQQQALKGSGEQAQKLAMYYALIRSDFVSELYWERIAAENGDSPLYMYNYAQMLQSHPAPIVDDNERQRVRFWLTKAADAGFAPAKEELSKLFPKSN